jgi:hypothetical protein
MDEAGAPSAEPSTRRLTAVVLLLLPLEAEQHLENRADHHAVPSP